MIYNMVHNEQDAWDLAQDSFLKAWKSIGRFRGQSSFYTWIYRIVMNVTIDWLRKKQVQGQRRGIRRRDSVEGNRSGFAHRAESGCAAASRSMEHQEIRGRIDAAIAAALARTSGGDFDEGN